MDRPEVSMQDVLKDKIASGQGIVSLPSGTTDEESLSKLGSLVVNTIKGALDNVQSAQVKSPSDKI
ncbi:hypothetical protein ACK32R_04870 [Aeromonas dhakensis]|jgi:hypothetical protein|uniref:hypothetical protein n=1 Tax=Aeromonas dhakensis TaxID=196024 RepID=UPI003987C68A